MENFETATALSVLDDGSFAWAVPDGWHVGRGVWGGLVIGVLISAITASQGDRARRVRSVSAELVGPAVVADHVITTSELRRGSALSMWNASLVDSAGQLVARLSAVLAEARPSADDVDYSSWRMLPRPDAPPASQVPVVAVAPPVGPEFGNHVEFRPVSGGPYSGPPAETLGYARLIEPVAHTAASLIGLVDAWWPTTLTVLDRIRPVATVAFSANLLVDPATVPPDEPLLHHGTGSGAHEGFSSEQRRLWTSDGRLAVDNLESMVLIK